MSFANPTSLRIGMTGDLSGRRYRVVGRVVMGMDEGGETYYWNEFNVVDGGGERATLVFEETERGGEWKLFTIFEPEYAMTAEDAATRKVGDELNLEGTQVRVTLVDESKVYQIEGEAPEGVEVGDVAHYFNAEAGNTMIVVSWTGDEVEFFRGVDLPHGVVARAFGLALEPRPSSLRTQSFLTGGSRQSVGGVQKVTKAILPFLVIAVFAVIFLANSSSCRSRRGSAQTTRVTAPAAKLQIGARGKLDGKTFRVIAQSVVEIAAVGAHYHRHEYQLLADDENSALLVQGPKDFTLFTPLEPLEPLTPTRAAALHLGEVVSVDGVIAPVTEMFRSTVLKTDPESPTESANGKVFFGFTGRTNSTVLLVRWTTSRIAFHRGQAFAEKEVIRAFAAQR